MAKSITPEQQLAEIKKYIDAKLKELEKSRKQNLSWVKLSFDNPGMLSDYAHEFTKIHASMATLNDLKYKIENK
jgi:hypothetical protein